MPKPTRIHRITSQSGRTITTGCGETITLKRNQEMPEVATGYESLVTCLACKRVRRQYHGEA